MQALFQSAQHIYEKREGSGAGSGSVPLTNGSESGSRRPKKHADPDPVPDPDPQHCFVPFHSKIGGGSCFQTLYAGDWNNEKSVPGIEDLEPLLQVIFY